MSIFYCYKVATCALGCSGFILGFFMYVKRGFRDMGTRGGRLFWATIAGTFGATIPTLMPIVGLSVCYFTAKVSTTLLIFPKSEYAKKIRVYYRKSSDTVRGWNGQNWADAVVGTSSLSYYGVKSPNINWSSTDVLQKLNPEQTFPKIATSELSVNLI